MIPITEIESVLAKLDPKTRARVQSAQDIKIEKQLTPSIGLNFALRGGLGYGRQALVWGNKSAGKSSFCLQMIALAQKEGKTCAWIDADCGGSCACATCHVYVDENFLNKIPKAQESEQDMIDFVQNADKSSRLSCQIIITNDLDGIVVRMPKTQS